MTSLEVFCPVFVMATILAYQLAKWMIKNMDAPDTKPENKWRG